MNSVNKYLLATIVGLFLLNSQCLAKASADKPECVLATKTLALDAGTMAYQEAGKGSHIVLLHGLFAQKEQWNDLACLLAAAGHTVIAPDLPGYGQSTGFAIPDYGLERQVALVHHFIETLGLVGFDLGGSSMGGAIAALYRQQYPDQVRSLAFIGSPLGIIGWGSRIRDAIHQGINPFIPIDTDQFDLEMGLLFYAPPSVPEATKKSLTAEYLHRNRHYQQVWNIVNLYGDIITQTPNSTAPTLIIWGENDGIYDVAGTEPLKKKVPANQLFTLPKASHLLMMENAPEAGKLYLEFLKGQTGKN